jgi:uncharacterized protein (DUF302 family)
MGEHDAGTPGLVRLAARGSVDQTFTRLEQAVVARGLRVFARIDFAADAATVGLTLPPMRLLIFGNPKAGTPLLAAAPTIGLDLPLKILVWAEASGETVVAYWDPAALAARHGAPPALVTNIAAVQALAAIAAGTA